MSTADKKIDKTFKQNLNIFANCGKHIYLKLQKRATLP
jgi:hypothetical protein